MLKLENGLRVFIIEALKNWKRKYCSFCCVTATVKVFHFFPLQSRRVKDEEKDVSQLSLSPTPALKPAFSFSFKNSLCNYCVTLLGFHLNYGPT